jgi:hypothetical protein
MISLTGGVDLVGLDGLALIATIVIIAMVVSQVRGGPTDGSLREVLRAASLAARQRIPRPDLSSRSVRTPGPARQPRKHVAAVRPPQREPFASLRRIDALVSLIGLAIAAAGAVLLAQGTAFLLAAAVLLAGAAVAGRRVGENALPAIDDAATEPSALLGRVPSVIRIAVPTLLTIAVFVMNRDRPLNQSRDDIVFLWMLAMATALLAFAPGFRQRGPQSRGDRRYLVALLGLVATAFAVRAWNGASYPWPVFQDEGLYALEALKAVDGTMQNPFSTGWMAQQTMLWFLQGAVMRVFGDDLAGSRLLAAIVGAAAAGFVFLYARRMFGLVAGLVAGALATVFHAAVYFSRAGWPSAGDILFMPLTLWLIDRGVFGRRQFEAVLAGIVIGFAQYYYQGGRAFIIVAGAILLYGLVLAWRARATTPGAVGDYLRVAWLTPAGAVVAFAPLGAYAFEYWEIYTGRIRGVSMFSSGWLDREIERTGSSALDIIFHRFIYALGVLVRGPVDGHFRPEAPFVGWPLVIPVAGGIALCLVRGWHRRYAGMAIAFLITTLLVTMTEAGKLHSNRFAALIPLAMIAAGIFADAIWRRLRAIIPLRAAASIVVVVFVLYASWWHLHFYFHSPYQSRIYSTNGTEISTMLGYRLQPYADLVTLYVVSTQSFTYRGMPTIRFLAPEAVGIDVESPLADLGEPIVLDEFTIFVVLPQNEVDLATLRQWYPDGEQRDVYNRDGSLLYHEYRVNPGVGG